MNGDLVMVRKHWYEMLADSKAQSGVTGPSQYTDHSGQLVLKGSSHWYKEGSNVNGIVVVECFAETREHLNRIQGLTYMNGKSMILTVMRSCNSIDCSS